MHRVAVYRTPRNDPIELKRSRPADPEQDPDPAESSVARPTGSAGAALLLVAAVVQDVDESTDEMVAPETHDDAGNEMTTGAETAAPANADRGSLPFEQREVIEFLVA